MNLAKHRFYIFCSSLLAFASPLHAAEGKAGTAVALQMSDVTRVLFLLDHNTRVVVLSVVLLAVASALIGCFLLLRKRALMGDALSHATLPGIALAFMIMVRMGGEGKWLPGLLIGALVTGVLGMGLVLLITRWTLLQDDTALGIVLSVFFGIGIALLGLIQSDPKGSAAGLGAFIYGKTASMVTNDAYLIAAVAALIILLLLLLFKEFRILCFDAEFGASQGWPVMKLDIIMLTLVSLVTVIGLQAVGLILIIAMLIIPPAAARFWTESLSKVVLVAAAIGAVSGWIGASLSALLPKLPAGAVIVVTSAVFFFISLIFGPSRGILIRALERWRLRRKVAKENLLRAIYELLEMGKGFQPERFVGEEVEIEKLQAVRPWSEHNIRRAVKRLQKKGLLKAEENRIILTEKGAEEAGRVVRNHRLWETYLLKYADIATSHVDQGADRIEHVLGTSMIEELERELAVSARSQKVPPSPHAITRV
jgi:manganese/zinc/iron transport system permease protein